MTRICCAALLHWPNKFTIESLSRAGPGLIEVFGKRLNQPFDGDGLICQFAFRDGKLHFR